MDTPDALIDDYAAKRHGDAFGRMLALCRANSNHAFDLLRLAAERRVESSTFLDAAVSFVPAGRLHELADLAAAAFPCRPKYCPAEAIISYLALQAVETLRPHLAKFDAGPLPNKKAYYSAWPWRGADADEIDRQLAALASSRRGIDKAEVMSRVCESRVPEAMAHAKADPHDLRRVGFDRPDRRLFDDETFHITFPAGHLEAADHPTWNLPPGPGTFRFGGPATCPCAVCGETAHLLIDLRSAPAGRMPDVPRIEVVTCLSCVGWTEHTLFFRHAADGSARPMKAAREAPKFPSGPLLAAEVELSATPARWAWQDWALSNSRESLHRVGGHPTWVQSAGYPECPGCRRATPFLMQLDSGLPRAGGSGFMWGSGGLCYVFYCVRCRVSASMWQCT